MVSGFGPSSTLLLKFMRVSEYRGTKIGTGSGAEGFLRVPVNFKKPDCFHFRATSRCSSAAAKWSSSDLSENRGSGFRGRKKEVWRLQYFTERIL